MGRRKRIFDQLRALLFALAFGTLRGQNGDREEALLQVRHVADRIADTRIALAGLAEALQIGTRRLHG
jgi:hypothetical protein